MSDSCTIARILYILWDANYSFTNAYFRLDRDTRIVIKNEKDKIS